MRDSNSLSDNAERPVPPLRVAPTVAASGPELAAGTGTVRATSGRVPWSDTVPVGLVHRPVANPAAIPAMTAVTAPWRHQAAARGPDCPLEEPSISEAYGACAPKSTERKVRRGAVLYSVPMSLSQRRSLVIAATKNA